MIIDLIDLLLADTGVTDIVGDNVRPMSRAQGDALPAITVTHVDGGPEYADDGEIGLRLDRVQCDCWALTYGEAKALAAQVQSALSAVVDIVQGDTTFRFIMTEAERDFRETGSGEKEYPFRTLVDFEIWTDTT